MQVSNVSVGYFWDEDELMRWWKLLNSEFDSVYQIVLPTRYSCQIMKLAHKHICLGYLGVTKTFDRISRHFFWSSLKSSVSAFARSCHICQLASHPNQVIPQAPLRSIPVIGEAYPSQCWSIA